MLHTAQSTLHLPSPKMTLSAALIERVRRAVLEEYPNVCEYELCEDVDTSSVSAARDTFIYVLSRMGIATKIIAYEVGDRPTAFVLRAVHRADARMGTLEHFQKTRAIEHKLLSALK